MTKDKIAELLEGVEMPEPDTHCWDSDAESDVWSYSKDQLRETVAAAAAKKDAEIAALKAENERLRGDAARYQWLRDNGGRGSNRIPHVTQYPFSQQLNEQEHPHFLVVGLDAAIDAAMKGQP